MSTIHLKCDNPGCEHRFTSDTKELCTRCPECHHSTARYLGERGASSPATGPTRAVAVCECGAEISVCWKCGAEERIVGMRTDAAPGKRGELRRWLLSFPALSATPDDEPTLLCQVAWLDEMPECVRAMLGEEPK